MNQVQAELEQAAANREIESNSFDNAFNIFAKDDETPRVPEPPRPPEPAIEGDEPPAPEPEPAPPTEPGTEPEETKTEAKSPALIALEKELSELRRESKKERQRADYWMQSFQQRVTPPPEPPKQPEAAPFAEPKPRLSQFQTTDEWEDAVFKWVEARDDHATARLKQEIFHEQARQQTEQRQAEEMARYFNHVNTRIAEGQTKFGQSAFNAACNDLIDFAPKDSPMYQRIFNLQKSADVIMELGKNLREAERISQLGDEDQIYELKSLEKKIHSREELARKAQTKIPTKVEAPGAGEDAKQSPSVAKYRQAAKASGALRDWGKVFQADPTL